MPRIEKSPLKPVYLTKLSNRISGETTTDILRDSLTKAESITTPLVENKEPNRNKAKPIRSRIGHFDYGFGDSTVQDKKLSSVITQNRQSQQGLEDSQNLVTNSLSRQNYASTVNFFTPRRTRDGITPQKLESYTPFMRKSPIQYSTMKSRSDTSPVFKSLRCKAYGLSSFERRVPNIVENINSSVTKRRNVNFSAEARQNGRDIVRGTSSLIQLNQGNFNDNIEALRQPNNLVWINGTMQKRQKIDAGACFSPTVDLGEKAQTIRTNKYVAKEISFDGKLPKVAFIRRKFEARSSPEVIDEKISSQKKTTDFIPRVILPRQCAYQSKDIKGPPPWPPTPTPELQPELGKKDLGSPSIARKDLSQEYTRVGRNKASQDMAQNKYLAPKSIIGRVKDKIKLFERNQNFEAKIAPQRKESITRKLNRNLKDLFEGWSLADKVTEPQKEESKKMVCSLEEPKNEGITGQGMSNITLLQEIQIKRTGNDVGCNKFSRSSPDERDWLIKEAECGLKQPKPLRAAEMRRMTLLCRGTVNGKSRMSSLPRREDII
ncbi:hypothetical protein K3495_g1727 [Podosphaera aphanis]|nr:hypothetical protein K3495_g1727 [Podosphaera aphanis]